MEKYSHFTVGRTPFLVLDVFFTLIEYGGMEGKSRSIEGDKVMYKLFDFCQITY